MRSLIFILIVFAGNLLYAQNTWYVSPDGNDSGNGKKNDPWKSWGKAFNSPFVSPGDTVYFRGGVYYKNIQKEEAYLRGRGFGYKIERVGQEGKMVHYWAYPGEKPILDCERAVPVDNSSYGINAANVEYCHFKGLTVRNVWSLENGYNGSSVQAFGWKSFNGSNNIYDECTAYNIHGIGFENSQGKFAYYLNCDAFNCCDSFAVSPQLPGNRGSGFSIINPESHTDTVSLEGCRAWLCGDQGFAMRTEAYVEFENCWAIHNGMLQGGGHGFKLSLNREVFSRVRRKLTNCLAVYNRESGITTNDNNHTALGMILDNNTAYHNGYYPYWGDGFQGGFFQAGFVIYNTSSPDEVELKRIFRNNISYDNEKGKELELSDDAVYTHIRNSWDTLTNITDQDFVSLDSAKAIVLLLGQRQKDGSLPDLEGFLEVAPTSALIDAGLDLGYGYNGEGPDLGARECSTQKGSDNKYPVIQIISPANGSIREAGMDIDILADAYDSDGSMLRVEFFTDGIPTSEILAEPWLFTWSDPPLGTYSIRAVATDNENASVTSARIEMTIIPDADNPDQSWLFPNPNNGTFTFLLSTPLEDPSDVHIFSSEGRVVYTGQMSKQDQMHEFDLTGLGAGMYVLFLSSNDSILSKKFMKL